MADTKISALTALVAGDIQHTSDVVAIVDTSVTTTKKATAQAVVNAVLAQNTDTTVTGTINQTTIPTSKTLLVSTDIGSTVQGYDATTLKSANIGVTVQGYDAQLADVAGLAVTDGNFIVGNGTNFVAESGSTARTSLGLGTGDSPEFTAVNIGNATDTTVTRVSAGVIAVEGSNVLLASNIGTTVQGYDADTAKLDVAQTFTAAQTFNNPTVFSAGTASLPSITFTGDTNTGIFSPAADTIAFTEGGAEAMRIDSSGNVGIGTTSPNIGSANADNAILTLKGKASTRSGIFEMGNFGTTANDQTLGWNRYFDGSTENANIEVARASSTSTAYMKFSTNGGSGVTERMRIDSSGNVGIGTASPSTQLHLYKNAVGAANLFLENASSSAGAYATVQFNAGTVTSQFFSDAGGGVYAQSAVLRTTSNHPLIFGTNSTERARITSDGSFLVGNTTDDQWFTTTNAGFTFNSGNFLAVARSGGSPIIANRLTSDGDVIEIRQAGTTEGTISVSGTTVSYNGGHLSRWAQMPGTKDDTIVKGTVMSNLDEMNVYIAPTTYWTEEDELPEGVNVGDVKIETHTVDNEQLNKVKVSDVEGDVNVAGVFVNWTHDDAHQVDEINMAMTGDMIIRIAQGVIVQKGDLLMSAGDGTAKPQGDDIVRSKTVAKVTSNHVTCTYADGSYCVPCVLMAC